MRFALIACGVSLLGLGLATACSSPTIRAINLTEDGGPATSTSPTNPKPGTTSGGTSGSSGTPTGNSTCDKNARGRRERQLLEAVPRASPTARPTPRGSSGLQTEGDALQACAAKATSFKCSSAGKPTVASGCDTEGQALLTSTNGGSSSGSSGSSSSGGSSGGNCGNLQSGVAACDTCQAAKCCAQARACSANAACGDILSTASPPTTARRRRASRHARTTTPAGKAAEQAFYGCLETNCSTRCQSSSGEHSGPPLAPLRASPRKQALGADRRAQRPPFVLNRPAASDVETSQVEAHHPSATQA